MNPEGSRARLPQFASERRTLLMRRYKILLLYFIVNVSMNLPAPWPSESHLSLAMQSKCNFQFSDFSAFLMQYELLSSWVIFAGSLGNSNCEIEES